MLTEPLPRLGPPPLGMWAFQGCSGSWSPEAAKMGREEGILEVCLLDFRRREFEEGHLGRTHRKSWRGIFRVCNSKGNFSGMMWADFDYLRNKWKVEK